MPTLNRFQYAILDFIKLENSGALSLFFTKYDKEEAAQTFIRFLSQLIAGDTSAYITIQTHLPKLKELAARLPETNLKTNSLSRFLLAIEDLIRVIERGAAFAPLDSNQLLTIQLLCSKEFIQFLADTYYLPRNDNKDIQSVLDEIRHTANTGKQRTDKLMYNIYYAYYGIASTHFSDKDGIIKSRVKNYIFYTLLAYFLKPTALARFLGFFTGIITGGIIKPLAHNLLYHFLMLFHSSEKKYHLLAILACPVLPFILGWEDCRNGTYNGYRSLIYNLNYLSKHHHNGLALLSLLVLSAAVAASLLALFFPPVIPLLITFFPIFANLSLPFIVTTVGLATAVSLTVLAAIGVTIHSLFTPRKEQKQTALKQSVLSEQSDRKVDELELALRELEDSVAGYQPVLTPRDQTSINSLPRSKQAALEQSVLPEQSDRKEDELELALSALGNSLAEYQAVLTPGVQTSTTSPARGDDQQNMAEFTDLAVQQQLRS